MKPKLVVLINPTTLYKPFCEACIKRNINIIRLYTFTFEESYLQLNSKYFIAEKELTKNFDRDIKIIRDLISSYELLAAIPSIENDLLYAEQLAAELSPAQSNNPKNAYLRYKKFEMNEALGQAGLNHIPQIRLHLPGSIDSKIPLSFPLVVKPSFQSGGSVGVKICNNCEEVQKHLENLKELKDPYGKKLEADIIIQEKIEGSEYFADSVSWQGKHYISSIFKYEKVNIEGLLIYRYADYIRPQQDVWKLSYDYIQKVLDILQLQFGFGHTEFILRDNKQPFLMELNPRLSGLGGTANFVLKMIGRDDASELYLDLLSGNPVAEKRAQEFKPQSKHGRILCLFPWKKMTFKGLNSKIFEKLQSSQHVFFCFKSEGKQLSPPKRSVRSSRCSDING